jgi:hypothetical protein
MWRPMQFTSLGPYGGKGLSAGEDSDGWAWIADMGCTDDRVELPYVAHEQLGRLPAEFSVRVFFGRSPT